MKKAFLRPYNNWAHVEERKVDDVWRAERADVRDWTWTLIKHAHFARHEFGSIIKGCSHYAHMLFALLSLSLQIHIFFHKFPIVISSSGARQTCTHMRSNIKRKTPIKMIIRAIWECFLCRFMLIEFLLSTGKSSKKLVRVDPHHRSRLSHFPAR